MDKENSKVGKVSIFTIFGSNYGAILQAFALQKYIRIHYPEFKTYLCNTAGKTKANILGKRYSPNFIKDVIIKVIVLFRYHSLMKSYKRKELFKKEEFNECGFNQIEGSILYLTGSDQIFNPSMGKREVFFQSFPKGNGIKAAYAPSFGVSAFPDEFITDVKPLLEDFDYLSCREKAGVDFLSNLLNHEVKHVCDPTLLLDRSVWHDVGRNNKYGRYIFIYDLNGGQELVNIALKIKSVTHLKIVCQTQKPQRFYKGVDYQIYDSGPREFVGLFESASYVVTDSFHGLVFSLIFNRPLSLLIASPSTSSRILEIVKMIGIEDSVIYSSSAFSHIPTEISSESRDKLSSFIEASKSFIDTVLNNARAIL